MYGEAQTHLSHKTWDTMKNLSTLHDLPWLCMGDFNETLYASEHFSRAARSEAHMRSFREVLDELSFQDLGWSGTAYTWDNHQMGKANVKSRLDRAFANKEFRQPFHHIRVDIFLQLSLTIVL